MWYYLLTKKCFFMKRMMSLLVIGLTLAVVSCKKNTDQSSGVIHYQISASKVTNVGRKQPNVFTINSPVGANVKWSCIPPTGVFYSTSGNKAYMRFNNPGTYTVFASFGGTLDSTVITVDTTVYSGDTTMPGAVIAMDTSINNLPVDTSTNHTDTYSSLNGGVINIVPSVTTDTTGGSYLSLSSSTTQTYQNTNPILLDTVSYVYSNSSANSISGILLVYTTVYLPGTNFSSSVSNSAKNANYLASLKDGTYTFEVDYYGVKYNGSITKSGNTYTFNWPNNGPIKISPLTVHL